MGKMIVKNMILGEVGTNCYIVYDEDSKDAAVIDPADRGDLIAAYIEENSLKLSAIYLTHGHFDGGDRGSRTECFNAVYGKSSNLQGR